MATQIDVEVMELAQRIPIIARLEQEEADAVAHLQDVRVRLAEARGLADQRIQAIRGKLGQGGGRP